MPQLHFIFTANISFAAYRYCITALLCQILLQLYSIQHFILRKFLQETYIIVLGCLVDVDTTNFTNPAAIF